MSRRLIRRAGLLALALASCPAAVSAQESPSAGTHAVRYDLLRRVTGTIAPDPDGAGPLGFAATRNTHDDSGQLVRVEKGELQTWQPESVAPRDWTGLRIDSQVDTAYDAMGRKVREAASGGGVAAGVTEYSYDRLGRLRCTAVRMNPAVWAAPLAVDATRCLQPGTPGEHGPDRITRNHYTDKGDLAKVEEGVGTSLARYSASYTYTPNGKRESLTDANGSTARMTWDGLDRQARWIFPSKTVRFAVNEADYEEYGHDPNGNRTRLRKRDGSVLTYQYDALNRLSAKIVPERADLTAAQTRDVHYEYDNRGLQTAASFGAPGFDMVRTWYDGFGQPATVLSYMSGQPRYLNHQYDADGNREHLTFANDNARFRYFYDGLGRMTAVHDKPNYSGPDDLVVRYLYRPEGPRHVALFGSGSAGLSTGYYYDHVQRLAAIGNDLAAAGADWSINLAYNPAGQIVRRELSHDGYAWSEGRSDSRYYETNGLNQYTQVGPNRYEHDANGNLTGDGITTYTYDVENRLVAASNGARLAYDPLGRLAEVSSPSTGVTRFQYDGDRLVAEYDSAGTLLKRYVHGPGVDEPVAVYEGPALGLANRRYLLADERGSIVAAVPTDGSAPAVNIYDEWGYPGRNNKGRFQYTGQTYIPELGLYYYKARFYSPILGRFMQTDPIGYEGGLNIYAYVGNDPVNRTDPSGLDDVNLIKDPNDRAGHARIDFPNAFTISAHGSTYGLMDEMKRDDRFSDGNARHDADAALEIARAHGYKGGLTIFLVCNIGTPPPGESQSFAQDYADKSGAKVVATTGLMGARISGERITLSTVRGARGPSGIYVFEKGKAPKYLGERLHYDPKRGIRFDDVKTVRR